MRFFTIPENFALVDDVSGKPFETIDLEATQPTPQQMQMGMRPKYVQKDLETFWSWLLTFVLKGPEFNKDFETWDRLHRVTKALKGVAPGVEAVLDEDDWKLLVTVIKTPAESPYRDGFIAMQFHEYRQAVLGASGASTMSEE